jgi:hypothetical protein
MAIMGEIPSGGYNPARTAVNPNDPDYLKKLALVGAVEGQHELNAPAMPVPAQAGTLPMSAKEGQTPPVMAQPEVPTEYSEAMAQKPGVYSLMDKAKGIQNKPLRILGEIGTGLLGGAEAVGEGLFPTIAAKIPGSIENVAGKQAQAFERTKAEEAEQLEQQKIQSTEDEKQAEIKSRQAIADQTNAIREELGKLADSTKVGDTNAMIASREKIADLTRQLKTSHDAQQYAEFKVSDGYKKWKTKLDDDTKIKVAEMTANKAPAQMLQNATMAQGALRGTADMRADMKKLEDSGVMGSLPANWIENWIFEKNAVDPNLPADVRATIGHLRTASDLVASATTRAHTARGSKEVYDDIKQKLGPGQDWNALKGSMDEVDSMLTPYVDAASNENIQKLRQGNAAGGSGAAPAGPPKGAKVMTLDDFLKGK